MRRIRDVIDAIVSRRSVLQDILHPCDVVAGAATVCDDAKGAPIVLDEISIRAILTRMDTIYVERVDAGTVRVSAWYMACAIDDRDDPIHRAIPDRIAGAPLRDRRALRRLRDLACSVASRGSQATMTLVVPESVAGWTGIRRRRHERAMHLAWG